MNDLCTACLNKLADIEDSAPWDLMDGSFPEPECKKCGNWSIPPIPPIEVGLNTHMTKELISSRASKMVHKKMNDAVKKVKQEYEWEMFIGATKQ